tara:strand:- start:1099 stop:2241 length:1143 start_codon:yes stop_codon:yes gene_type:complete
VHLANSRELKERHLKLLSRFKDLGIDALIVTHNPNVFYLSNHVGSSGYLLVTASAVYLLVDNRYAESAKRMQEDSSTACPLLQVWQVSSSYDETLVEGLASLEVSKVGFESKHLDVSRFEFLKKKLIDNQSNVELQMTADVIAEIRMIKDAGEVERIRESASMLTEVAESAFRAVRPGVSELKVARLINESLSRVGFDRVAFDTIVASGPNSALPHHHPGQRCFKVGDLVVLDFGGVLDGYCCDLTRTVSVGQPGPEAQRVYSAVHEAQQAAIHMVRPNVSTVDVDGAARLVLQSNGLGEAFSHGTGHGLGLEVHELPRVTKARSDAKKLEVLLKPGMVFTIEPGAYIPGWGGVRIEDDILVTNDGYSMLTSVARDLVNL